MGKIVLLAVAAAWIAVLLPPLLRSRNQNRPGSSVTDFRRQLSSLQSAVPTRAMVPMRGRGLVQSSSPSASPLVRPAATGRPGQPRVSIDPAARSAALERRAAARPTHSHRVSRREQIRRRRTNVLFLLALSTVVTLFLMATTNSHTMWYAFAVSGIALCGYCYKLAQIRQFEARPRRDYTGEHNWFAA